MTVVSIDGAIVPVERAVVPVTDRGFLYGDGVFEVLRTYGGLPFALDEHLARLARALSRVHLAMPVTMDALRRELQEALAAAPPGESYVRIMVTRGESPLGLDTGTATRARRVIFVEPLRPPSLDTYARGIQAVTRRSTRALGDVKGLGYLASIVFLHEARVEGAGEALLVDALGRVQEGATSNVFAVAGGHLFTPPEGSILPGITRLHVLDAARAEGIVTHVEDLTVAALRAAREVFITSSIRELVPVVVVDGDAIGDGAPGAMTRALHRAFRGRVHSTTGGNLEEAMPWE